MAALPRRRLVIRYILRLWTLLMPCCGAAITRCGGPKADFKLRVQCCRSLTVFNGLQSIELHGVNVDSPQVL